MTGVLAGGLLVDMAARLNQIVEDTGVATVATACPYCLTMLGDAIKETEREDTHKALDIAELVARAAGL